MACKSPRLTPALRTHIVSSIRSGGYLHIAGEAWGVPRPVLDEWLARGASTGREPYASFARDVAQAEAQARLRAEVEVFQNEPRYWLEHGPGRETMDRAGWSTAVKAAEIQRDEGNPWLNAELTRVFQLLLAELAPQPELRERIARIVAPVQSKASGKTNRAA